MDAIAGALVRFTAGLTAASPTLVIGLFISAVLRYYLGRDGTIRLFGGAGLRSLPQSWLVGMLLPVCSIGVIPIIREMRRLGIRPGAITAFALSAPLFNPLSLLYGLTLSRPFVIVGFAIGSLVVVTLLGIIWDRKTRESFADEGADGAIEGNTERLIGGSRLAACCVHFSKEVLGPTGVLTLIAISGLGLLAFVLPHGALQSSVEQLDPLAPLRMALISVPIYAPPMLTMSQLGMMFQHGNSPGAAFCLLLLGTGVNLATLVWVFRNFGLKAFGYWFVSLFAIVLVIAYAVDRPLIPPGVEPAGHTHAFDIYTNPFPGGGTLSIGEIGKTIRKNVDLASLVGVAACALMVGGGLVLGRTKRYREMNSLRNKSLQDTTPSTVLNSPSAWDREVSPRVVGFTCLVGLVAVSIVGCFAYYPSPNETLEELRVAKVELLSGVSRRDFEATLYWIPIVDEWSRKLEVGYAIRRFELRPYQQMQAYLLREKLEMLEHATEHAKTAAKDGVTPEGTTLEDELEEIDELRYSITLTGQRLTRAFSDPPTSSNLVPSFGN